MAKFNYKLQNILTIKYKLEDQAKSQYAQANEKLRQEELKLQAIYDDIMKYQNSVREMGTDKLRLMELKQCSQAIEFKKEQARLQLIQIRKAEQELEIARIKLNEVMTDRKTHEKLKEKAFEEFVAELEASEKKEIDELVSFKFNKKNSR